MWLTVVFACSTEVPPNDPPSVPPVTTPEPPAPTTPVPTTTTTPLPSLPCNGPGSDLTHCTFDVAAASAEIPWDGSLRWVIPDLEGDGRSDLVTRYTWGYDGTTHGSDSWHHEIYVQPDLLGGGTEVHLTSTDSRYDPYAGSTAGITRFQGVDDLTGDGLADVILGTPAGTWLVSAPLVSGPVVHDTLTPILGSPLAVHDVDGDGNTDLIFQPGTFSPFQWCSAPFTAAVDPATCQRFTAAEDFVWFGGFGDYGGDGVDDLFVSQGYQMYLGEEVVMAFVASGPITEDASLPIVARIVQDVDQQVWVLPSADVDGDGALEIVLNDADAVRVIDLPTDGSVVDLRDPGQTLEILASAPSILGFVDIEGDGAMETILRSPGANGVVVTHGALTGAVDVLSASYHLAADLEADEVWVMVGDFDGDGRGDIVVEDVARVRSWLYLGADL